MKITFHIQIISEQIKMVVAIESFVHNKQNIAVGMNELCCEMNFS